MHHIYKTTTAFIMALFLLATSTAYAVVGEYPLSLNPYLPSAYNSNGRGVAQELYSLMQSNIGPNGQQEALLARVDAISSEDLGVVLDDMSGSQYACLLLSTELSTRQFSRRLYDPMREFLALNPLCDEADPCYCGFTLWEDAGTTYGRFNDTDQSKGFKTRGYQVTVGAQMAHEVSWVAGTAFSYEHTNSGFRAGGTGNTKSFFGGVYGATRFCNFYLMGNGILAGSVSNVRRCVSVGPRNYAEKGKPESFQGLLYAELGRDFRCGTVAVQPFFGLEGGYYFYKHFHEYGDEPLDLKFHRRRYGTFDMRLGVHLVSQDLWEGFFCGVDLAWQYRCTAFNGFLDTRFVDSVVREKEEKIIVTAPNGAQRRIRRAHKKYPSETYYRTNAMNLTPNSVTTALNVEQELFDNWSVFATGNWQQWSNACAYDVLAGIGYTW